MADACFTARATTRDHVKAAITKLELPRNSSNQYTHDAITTFFTGIRRVLKSKYNPGDPGNGMEKLLTSSTANPPSLLSRIRSTDAATITSVLDKSRATTNALSTTQLPVLPTITTRADAQDEADRINQINQAVIGAKEGTTEAITDKVGSDITDAVLRTADGTDYRSIDDYELHELVTAAIQGADRPNTSDVLEQLAAILAFGFDFQKKVITNIELLRAKIARMHSYGIIIDDTQMALVLLANIELAASEAWGREFRPALQTIRRTYAYNFAHTSGSITTILRELASADGVRKLNEATPPFSSSANAVTDQISYLTSLLQHKPIDNVADETAYAAQSDSESSAGKSRRSTRNNSRHPTTSREPRRDRDRARSRSQRRRNPHKDNPCKHCCRFRRNRQHPNIPEKDCFWNQKYKGFRQEWVCKEMGIPYKPRIHFAAALGGYPDSSGSDSGGD